MEAHRPPWKVLAAEGLEQEGIERLRESKNFIVDVRKRIDREELLNIISLYDVLLVRSSTRVDAQLIERGVRLRIIVRAGVGFDNIDLESATRRGILIQNVPGGNTNAVAELVTGFLVMLARDLYQASYRVKLLLWKAAKGNGIELQKKILGIVGLGRIGSLVAQKGSVLGMRCIAYDPYKPDEWFRQWSVERMPSLEALVAESDFITVHVPLNPETKGMFSWEILKRCKRGCFLINAARGGIVDEHALLDALNGNIITRAAVDVFEKETEAHLNTSLIMHPRIIATPHLGGSTVEARIAIAREAAEGIVLYLESNRIMNAVNIPYLPVHEYDAIAPYRTLSEKLARFLVGMSPFTPVHVELRISSRYIHAAEVLSHIVARELARENSEDDDRRRGYINARVRTEARGIHVESVALEDLRKNDEAIEVSFRTRDAHVWARGELLGGEPRLTGVNGYRIESAFAPWMIYYENDDVPGVVHKVSGVLFGHNINIGTVHIEDDPGQTAACIVKISSKGDNLRLFESRLDGIKTDFESLVAQSVISYVRFVRM